MDFALSRTMGPRWVIAVAGIGLALAFAAGLSNSIMFYEFLPKDLNADIIVFYQPTCPHCIAEIPTIKKLVADGYSVSAINVFKRPDLAEKYGVIATPTIIITRTGETLEGEQDYKTIVSALKNAKIPQWIKSGATCSVKGVAGTCSPT